MADQENQRRKEERNRLLRETGRNAQHQANYRAKFHKARSVAKLSEREKQRIKLFYKNRPDGMHVDHIIPLSKGGKHRLKNLQYMPSVENIRKQNKLTLKAYFLRLFSWFLFP